MEAPEECRIASRRIIQYDENMNYIKEFSSQKEASEETGISEYKMNKSRKDNKSVDGFFFLFKEELKPYNVEVECLHCGKVFMCTRQRLEKNKKLFCSVKCHQLYRIENSIKNCQCSICGAMFHRKPSAFNKNNVCSKKCLTELIRRNMSGKNNHQYGLTGEKNSSWKSNERISSYGYRLIRKQNHPFANEDGFVFEHRLIAEEYLLDDTNSVVINGKQYLSPDYVVHHLDFDKLNNDKDNLFVLKKNIHSKFHSSLVEIVKNPSNSRIVTWRKKELRTEEAIALFYEFINKYQDTKIA